MGPGLKGRGRTTPYHLNPARSASKQAIYIEGGRGFGHRGWSGPPREVRRAGHQSLGVLDMHLNKFVFIMAQSTGCYHLAGRLHR